MNWIHFYNRALIAEGRKTADDGDSLAEDGATRNLTGMAKPIG